MTAINISSNVSQSKDNQSLKLGQLTEYCQRNIKNPAEN